MATWLFALLVLAVARATPPPTPTPAFPYLPGAPGSGAWSLTFSDDFDGPALNLSTWNVRRNESHCCPQELELYEASNAYVEDGALVLATLRADPPAVGPGGALFNYTSAWVDTRGSFAQQYGLFEASMSLTDQNATGSWPAFWTLPANQSLCWPTGGEIDIFEYLSDPVEDSVFGSYRWGTVCGDDNQLLPGAAYPPTGAPAVDWTAQHVFAVMWNATQLSFFVDGNLYETKTAAEVILPSSPHVLIFDVAVAPFWPPGLGPDVYPAYSRVDWVRAFAWDGGAPGDWGEGVR
jgi:beta-glucanase (GH16 family)